MKNLVKGTSFALVILIITILAIPQKTEAFNPIKEYLIDPLAKVWEPWFREETVVNRLQIVEKTKETTPSQPSPSDFAKATSDKKGKESGQVLGLSVESSGLTKEEVQKMINSSISSLNISPIQNVTYVNGGGRSGITQGLADSIGRTTATLQSNIDSLSTRIDSISSNTTGSFATLTVTGSSVLPYASSTSITSSGSAYFATNGGSVGIGTTSPFATLSVNNVAGTPGFVVGSSTATSFIVDKNGNVGVGTTSPSYKLDVNGGIQASGFVGTAIGNNAQLSQSVPTNGSKYLFLSQNLDTTKAPWTAVVDTSLFGSTQDEGFCIGYNCAPGGGTYLSTEPSFRWKTEQDYQVGSDHFIESYFEWYCVTAVCGSNQQRRPIFWQFNKTNGDMTSMEVRSSGISFTDWSTGSVIANLSNGGSGFSLSGKTGTDTSVTFTAPNTNDVALNLSGRGVSFQTRVASGPIWYTDINGTTGMIEYTANGIGFGGVSSSAGLGGVINSQVRTARKDTENNFFAKYVASQSTSILTVKDSSGNFIGQLGGGDGFFSHTMNSQSRVGWSNSTTGLTIDTALYRNAAGVLEINNGTAGQYRDIQIRAINPSSGNLGISTTSPWRTLSVNGTVAVPGLVNDSTGFYACVNTTNGQLATSTGACGASSIKYKENVEDIKYGLNEIIKLRPVSFDYKKEYIKDSKHQIGFIAEEVDPVIPEVVTRDSNNEIQGLDYPKFTAVLAKAIQELNTKFNTLTSILGDGAEGLKNLVLDSLSSTEIYTKEISADKANLGDTNFKGNVCVNNTCITKDQLEQLILRSGVGAVQVSQDDSLQIIDDSQTGTSTEAISTTIPKITEEISTSTPEMIETIEGTASTTSE